jgi:hypothetical protein
MDCAARKTAQLVLKVVVYAYCNSHRPPDPIKRTLPVNRLHKNLRKEIGKYVTFTMKKELKCIINLLQM